HHLGVLQKFVRAEAVAFDRAPGHLQTRGTFVSRADAVHPVVVRGEVATRPTQLRDVQSFHRFQHVAAEPVRVGEPRAVLEDSAVNASRKVLDEIPVDFGVDVSDHALGVNLDAGAEWAFLRADGEGRGDQGCRQPFREAAPGDFHSRVLWGRMFQGHLLISSKLCEWYGTGSGSDLAPLGAATTEAPGRYRSLYRTADQASVICKRVTEAGAKA